MKAVYRELRLKQLVATLDKFSAAKHTTKPTRGWLRAVREALGLSQQAVANATKVKRQTLLKFENAEAEDRITLRNLRRVAEAMDCELVYAIVPKFGSIRDLAESRARVEATERVRRAEHTMALEDQASGNVEELIDEETKRIVEKL